MNIKKSFLKCFNQIRWKGSGVDEVGIDAKTGIVRVKVDKKYYRPTEVDLLLGNPSKAKQMLGWKTKVSFDVSNIKSLSVFIYIYTFYLLGIDQRNGCIRH